MRKTLGFVFLFFILCNNLFAQDQSTATKKISGPQIMFVNNDTAYDFGGVPLGASVPYQFEIKNTGDEPLIISGMKSESGNIQYQWPGKSIKPGKKGYLTVTYTAHGDEGSFKNIIYITSNATANPYPFIHTQASIIPANEPYTPSSPSGKSRGSRRGGGQ